MVDSKLSFANEVALDKVVLSVPLIVLLIADKGVLPLERITQKGEGGANCG